MNFRLPSWFFEITQSGNQRGDRLAPGDRPSSATFSDLVKSVVMRSDANYRAKEDDGQTDVRELAGHAVASTDTQAKAYQDKLDDRTLLVQPNQISESVTEDTIDITSNITPYTGETLEVVVDPSENRRNRFLFSLSTGLKTWFQTVADTLTQFSIDIQTLFSRTDQLRVDVDQNIDAIAQLIDPEAPTGVPVGTVLPWPTPVAPSGYFICNGQVLDGTTYATLKSVLAGRYNTGGEGNDFRIPDLRDRSIRGVNDGATIGSAAVTQDVGVTYGTDAVGLIADNLPQHRHQVSLETTEAGEHAHTLTWVNGFPSNERGTNNVGTSGGATNNVAEVQFATNAVVNQNGEHTHAVGGDTNFNDTANSPVDIINPVMLMHYIIKA